MAGKSIFGELLCTWYPILIPDLFLYTVAPSKDDIICSRRYATDLYVFDLNYVHNMVVIID